MERVKIKRLAAPVALLLCSLLTTAAVDRGSVRAAVQKSLPLLQKVGPRFWYGAGCISCHNNTLPDMAITIAKERGFAIDEAAAKEATKLDADILETRKERLLEVLPPGGGQNTMGSLLFSLTVQKFPRDEAMEAGARYLKMLQAPDGSWPIQNHRPPLVASTMTLTAFSIRALQVYAPESLRAQYDESVRKAVSWVANTEPRVNEEYAFKIFGLVWGHGSPSALETTMTILKRQQRADGGWGQLPALESDAYATGQALVALQASGMKTTDPVYRHGVDFLVRTQAPDGSWHVKTRSEPSQIYFEAGYPYGVDQFISSAGGSWATAALALTQP
jgi:Squalene-hopene cyclase C-terminal domain/Prenyltransferase and squalene oxidase repeat